VRPETPSRPNAEPGAERLRVPVRGNSGTLAGAYAAAGSGSNQTVTVGSPSPFSYVHSPP
jgi:hypothetical protein